MNDPEFEKSPLFTTDGEATTDAAKAAYEQRLRHRLLLLKDRLEAGKLKIPTGSMLVEELQAVRVGPDGDIDLSTVGPSVRSTALAVEAIEAREEAKSVSLGWVQTEYFAFLEDIFADYLRAMKEKQATPHAIASAVQANDRMSAQVIESFGRVGPAIRNLWDTYQFVVDTHLQDMGQTKVVYGGDIFPQHHSNTIACASLMSDTIILPDPVDCATNALRHSMRESEVVYQLVKHGLTMLSLKELAFADLEVPLVVVSGDYLTGENEQLQLWTREMAVEDAMFHLNTVLRAEASSIEEIVEILNRLYENDELDARVAAPERLLPDDDSSGTIKERMERITQFRNEKVSVQLPSSFGEVVMMDTVGRMMQANVALRRSIQCEGIPLIDAPTSWRWLQWKFEYDSARGQGARQRIDDIATANALTSSFATESRYLSRLTPTGIVQVRQVGILNELRERLREGVAELLSADESTFENVSRRIIANLDHAFAEFDAELHRMETAGKELVTKQIPWFLASASLAFAGPITGNYALSLLGVASSLVGGPDLKDLWSKGREAVREGARLRRTPMGILVWT